MQRTEGSPGARVVSIVKRGALYLGVAALGFVVGAFLIYIVWMTYGPSLELWHTEELDAEFSTDRLDEIHTFDDYLKLEADLFAELAEEIYARTESGFSFSFARYSDGSRADWRDREPDWNRSFELPAEAPRGGVLLLHGMSDSPYSLRAIGQGMNEQGYHVVGLRLPGHGTVPSGLSNVTMEEMAAVVRLAVDHLATETGRDSIHIVGYSTGAALAVEYALAAMDDDEAPVPASLVLISPAVGISPAAALAKWNGRLALLPGLEKLAWNSILPEFDPYKYNSFTINAAVQVRRLTVSMAGNVETRAASGPIEGFPPTLVFLSTVDATVSADAVIDNLLEHLAPGDHELVLFDVNRNSIAMTVLVSDPGPLTTRLMANDTLPFHLTLITNENEETDNVVSRCKEPLSSQVTTEHLGRSWPINLISLSHVALPFPPDDPLYGRVAPVSEDHLYLGQIAVQGERGLLKFPSDMLLRLRHNPFYELLETRAIEWVDEAGPRSE
jgi:alpha-beta hydrolase superfamily lysophospholipase